jgi:hypothetical protein
MPHGHAAQSLDRLAFSATSHCRTRCAIGEVLEIVIGTLPGWNDWQTVVHEYR